MANKVDTEKIKRIRESTDLSFKHIGEALEEAGGDETKAMEILKAKGMTIALKKSSREVKEGVVDAYIHGTKKLGSIVELLCETDFVARNSEFQKLAHEIAMQIAVTKPQDAEELLSQPFIRDESVTIKDLIDQYVAKLGENIKVGRFIVFEI